MATLQDWLQKADDGKPGESLGETSTEELKATLAKLKPTDPGAEGRISAIKAELKKRGGEDMDKGCGPMHKGELSPEKARQMLHERSGGHGRPITEQQRKYFGAIGGHLPAPGGKAKKSMTESLEDWLEKATPIGGITPGGYKRVKKDEYVKVTKTEHTAHTAKEEKERQEGPSLFDMFFTPEGEKKMAEETAKYEAAEKPISVTAQVAKMLKEKASDEDILDVLADVPVNTLLRMDFGAIGKDEQGRDLPKSRATIRKTGQHGWELHKPTDEQKRDFSNKIMTHKNVLHLLTKMGSAGAAPAGERPIPEPKKAEPAAAPAKKEAKPKAAKPKKLSDTHAKVLSSAQKFQAITPGGSFATYKQVDKLVDNGLLEAAGRGQYKLTEAGKEALNTGKFTAPMKKSEVDMTLQDWLHKAADDASYEDLQKSGGLPTHEPKLGAPKSSAVEGGSADGGEVAGVGMTSGSSDSAPGPGQDGQGQIKGVGTGTKQKLSDDDADEEKQMSAHKKPIETVRKSRFPADQRASVAHETAQRVSQLQKSQDVYVGPSAHPLSHVRQHGGVDAAASELVKSEGFYHGRSPQSARPTVPLGEGVLCKSVHAGGCDETYSAALTACPGCGAGTVGHRVLPGAVIMGAESRVLEKSEGPGSLLRRPPQEPDIKIGE